MSDKPVKLPGPDHPITIEPHPGKVTVRAGNDIIAQTSRALVLKEAAYPPVFYIPREDANMVLLERTDHATHCPYKGEASYFSLSTGDAGKNGVWSYEAPYPEVASIKGYIAFYQDRVTVAVGTAPSLYQRTKGSPA